MVTVHVPYMNSSRLWGKTREKKKKKKKKENAATETQETRTQTHTYSEGLQDVLLLVTDNPCCLEQ